ncbi:MalM family protein [Vibrio intestinalis]|uniref:MalM family protein n=1 Tax=Vibrio intestinalis TaxID=2933291 RepID=UPI0021A28F5D|nr:MalM family protein [Vibrio intestinalis]
MILRTMILSGCVLLSGCQLTQPAEQHTQVIQTNKAVAYDQLQHLAVTLPGSAIVDINDNSQYLSYAGIDSPVAVFEIPANRGEYNLTVTSLIEETAFVPRAVIIDKAGNLVAKYDQEEFKYTKPRLADGNRLVLDTDFFPPAGNDSMYLIVYTDQSELGGYTGVIHPAQLDAEARGNHFPMDPVMIPNALTGKIEVELGRASFFRFGSEPSTSQTSPVANLPKETVSQVEIKTVVPETQTYYHNAIKSAVESNNLDKALSLLDEAKALNIEGAQEIFIKAVNAK